MVKAIFEGGPIRAALMLFGILGDQHYNAPDEAGHEKAYIDALRITGSIATIPIVNESIDGDDDFDSFIELIREIDRVIGSNMSMSTNGDLFPTISEEVDSIAALFER